MDLGPAVDLVVLEVLRRAGDVDRLALEDVVVELRELPPAPVLQVLVVVALHELLLGVLPVHHVGGQIVRLLLVVLGRARFAPLRGHRLVAVLAHHLAVADRFT